MITGAGALAETSRDSERSGRRRGSQHQCHR
jgi:hypothetical protein